MIQEEIFPVLNNLIEHGTSHQIAAVAGVVVSEINKQIGLSERTNSERTTSKSLDLARRMNGRTMLCSVGQFLQEIEMRTIHRQPINEVFLLMDCHTIQYQGPGVLERPRPYPFVQMVCR